MKAKDRVKASLLLVDRHAQTMQAPQCEAHEAHRKDCERGEHKHSDRLAREQREASAIEHSVYMMEEAHGYQPKCPVRSVHRKCSNNIVDLETIHQLG